MSAEKRGPRGLVMSAQGAEPPETPRKSGCGCGCARAWGSAQMGGGGRRPLRRCGAGAADRLVTTVVDGLGQRGGWFARSVPLCLTSRFAVRRWNACWGSGCGSCSWVFSGPAVWCCKPAPARPVRRRRPRPLSPRLTRRSRPSLTRWLRRRLPSSGMRGRSLPRCRPSPPRCCPATRRSFSRWPTRRRRPRTSSRGLPSASPRCGPWGSPGGTRRSSRCSR